MCVCLESPYSLATFWSHFFPRQHYCIDCLGLCVYAPGLPANERQRYQLPLPNGSRGGRKGEKERAKKVQTAGGGGAVVRGRFAPVLLWNEKKTRAISH